MTQCSFRMIRRSAYLFAVAILSRWPMQEYRLRWTLSRSTSVLFPPDGQDLASATLSSSCESSPMVSDSSIVLKHMVIRVVVPTLVGTEHGEVGLQSSSVARLGNLDTTSFSQSKITLVRALHSSAGFLKPGFSLEPQSSRWSLRLRTAASEARRARLQVGTAQRVDQHYRSQHQQES